MTPDTKPAYESKTVIFNTIIGAAGLIGAFCPPVLAYAQAHTVLITEVIAFAGIVLRFVTKDKIALY